MNNAYFNQFDRSRAPARERNLFISPSKHLYLTKGGELRRQEKALDARIPGAKRLLTRLAILDIDTGTVYGELHDEATAKDLIGFLARAWYAKALHPMRGIPRCLNVPAVALKDAAYRADLQFVRQRSSLQIGELPSGFAAGVHALKQLESGFETLLWEGRSKDLVIDLELVRSATAADSLQASNSLSSLWNEKWLAVTPPPAEFFTAVDALYKVPGAWRLGPFEEVLNWRPEKS